MSDLDVFAKFAGMEHGLAVISTARADGTIQSSVVNAGVMNHPVSGKPVVAFVAAGSSKRLNNLRARPHATIVLRAGWQWAGVEGSVQLIGPDEPVDGVDIPALLRDIFKAAGGTHEDWNEYDLVMAKERRVAVLIDPTRVYGNN
jgi:PPOX class probable F420-dependent enzyme